MKKLLPLLAASLLIVLISCKPMDKKDKKSFIYIRQDKVEQVTKTLISKFGSTSALRIEKGVGRVATLWVKTDGTEQDFEQFCMTHFVASEQGVDSLFQKLQTNFEILNGHFGQMGMSLRVPLDLDLGPVQPVDEMFGSFAPGAHLSDDLFANKVAFLVTLNFPFYSLKEKNELGLKWTRKQWAYARMGDNFLSREPADKLQQMTKVLTEADSYISEYNICMGKLQDKNGKTWFPADMKLITHWGLRDELKSHYADKEGGLEKQKVVYTVMKHIIDQSIPEIVINNPEVQWDPIENTVFKNGKTFESKPEPDTRYAKLLNNFKAEKALDPFNPNYPTYIDRAFDLAMEISQPEVEQLFTGMLTSPEFKQVGQLIAKRLNRPLQPFDIWYDGFKSRGTISEESLNKLTSERYPDIATFQKDLPNIMVKLGFTPEKAAEVSAKVQVDPARGSGHAAGATMKSSKSLLRTRFAKGGMNYKGYNIAIHEFGHNVEQTITLHDVDNYMMSGVPNTAFTEAVAFLFQVRDLELLGIKDENPEKTKLMALDHFWMSCEIMGVSLVDMKVWKWMYANPNATPAQLKEAVIAISKEVWNQYFSPVFGSKDEPILGVYSHMIDNPLYLPNYPIGHLVSFQVEQQIAGKPLANEILRLYTVGRLTPSVWLQQGVGKPLSIEPTLKAVDLALKN
ncbi:MAG: hypothetical protein WCO63_04770 [Bacteroidota bacterium]